VCIESKALNPSLILGVENRTSMSGDPPAAAMSVLPLHDAFTRTVGPHDNVVLKTPYHVTHRMSPRKRSDTGAPNAPQRLVGYLQTLRQTPSSRFQTHMHEDKSALTRTFRSRTGSRPEEPSTTHTRDEIASLCAPHKTAKGKILDVESGSIISSESVHKCFV
jgi:hypothetical protein